MEMPQRQDNIEFEQTPNLIAGRLPNGEAKLYSLDMRCKGCGQGMHITRATAKQCQFWLNIARMRHNTCHVDIEAFSR
jgi:hypothetical protein